MAYKQGKIDMINVEKVHNEFDEANIIHQCDWEIDFPINKTDGYYWVIGICRITGNKYEATADVFHGKITDINTPIMICD